MAYDERLAERVREAIAERDGVREKKMFGGLAFLLHGNMCCGIVGQDLMVRVGPDAYDEALAHPRARPMDFTGRSMKGMIYVEPDGLTAPDELAAWVWRGIHYAESLPPK